MSKLRLKAPIRLRTPPSSSISRNIVAAFCNTNSLPGDFNLFLKLLYYGYLDLTDR